MKSFLKMIVFSLIMASTALFMAPYASAAYANPIVSVSNEGGYGSVRVTVNSAPSYSTVNLYYRQGTELWTTISNVGQTDGNGYFSQVLNLGVGNNSSSQADYYVTVGGYTSNTITANNGNTNCYYNNYNCNANTNSLPLSTTSVSINAGQSSTVSVSSWLSAQYNLYVANNSNPSVVSVSASGNSVTFYGLTSGSSSVQICSNAFYQQCAYVFVTVSGGSSNNELTLSTSSLTMNTGENRNVTVYSNVYYFQAQSYYIASNSNNNVASAYLSGNTINVYALNSGSTTIRVCTNNASSCANLYVTVNGSNNATVTVSPTNLTLNVGQSNTAYVSVNGGYGANPYISTNGNPNVASAYISGNTVTVNGLMNGSSTITICHSSASSCASLFVSVSGNSNNNSVWFNPSSLTLQRNQTQTVAINSNVYSYGSYYVSSNSNNNIATAYVSGNSLYVTAINTGSTSIVVCQSQYSNCGTLYVTVTGYGGVGYVILNQTNLNNPVINQYYTSQLQATGGTSPYTYSLVSGNLPSGLSLSSSGQIYGTPYSSGSSTFTVRVTDWYGAADTKTFTLTVSGSVLGQSQYSNGTLIRENNTIYIIYRNTKTGFANWYSFQGLGFNLGNVIDAPYNNLSNTGYLVTNPNAAHPWGTWIKNGNTVYFVHEQGIIPVGDYGTFVNNGGSDNKVVMANSWDMMRPMLPVMQYADYRLQ